LINAGLPVHLIAGQVAYEASLLDMRQGTIIFLPLHEVHFFVFAYNLIKFYANRTDNNCIIFIFMYFA